MLSENIEFHRAAWAKVAKDNGWYTDPFYVQIWLDDDGYISDSVSHLGMTEDIIIPADDGFEDGVSQGFVEAGNSMKPKVETTSVLDMYETVDYAAVDIKLIVDGLEIVHQTELDKTDNLNDDGGQHLATVSMSGVQHFGATDYKEHRGDTKEQLVALIMPGVKMQHQRGHFYDSDDVPVKTLVVKGRLGGYSGYFLYPSGETKFGREARKVV